MILRTSGLVFLLAALGAVGFDVAQWVSTDTFRFHSAGELWFKLDPGSLNLAQAIIQRYILVGLWDPILIAVLQYPATAVLGIPGLLLFGLAWLRR